jgi:hypothetical protein
LTKHLNFRVVKLHVDFVVVVKAISATWSCSMRDRVLVEKIRRLLQLDWEVVIHHFSCEIN